MRRLGVCKCGEELAAHFTAVHSVASHREASPPSLPKEIAPEEEGIRLCVSLIQPSVNPGFEGGRLCCVL
jgi:hypothetical protein